MASSEVLIKSKEVPAGAWETVYVPNDDVWTISSYAPTDCCHFGIDNGSDREIIKLCGLDSAEGTSDFTSRPKFNDSNHPTFKNTDGNSDHIGYICGDSE